MAETLERQHPFRLDDAPPRNHGPAQRAVADYLSTQIDGIVFGDAGLRYRADPIPDTRVAIRSVRSTLRVFAKLVDDHDAAGELESNLKWFAALLGEGLPQGEGAQEGQGALGDHQDSVVARDVLRRMAGGPASAQGKNGFTYGLLYAREQSIARESRLKARKLVEKGQA
ncbi:CHAD domain-containing protein [Mycolicibacterium sp. P9-64]|uniref:CHAD domain-containing protein n=1 Tax=Mycolicibacterium sp. P9-64 TaxID=2024612 RepID=UPI0011EE08F7|nr:CHAD domain-containing protein [Mycolicibacterium sp. P9-64]KAA0080781.1 CHAD domain-containing protein [Mycolicibacterium sp. P9-64]